MEAVREGELHPLQNPAILEVMFKSLELGDLKSCRLVCREWCRGSTAAMKEVPLVVGIRNELGRRIPDFLELVRVEGEEDAFAVPPFMKDFKLYSVEGDSRIFWEVYGRNMKSMVKDYRLYSVDGDYRRFWEVCGRNMKSLDLMGVCFESGDIFRHAVFQSCPNLEALSMRQVTVAELNAEEPNLWLPPKFPPNRNLKSLETFSSSLGGVSWMEILSQFPALEKFHPGVGNSSLARFFASLALARRHDDQCWKINDLAFTVDGIYAHLPIFGPASKDLKLPLEKLQVCIYQPIVGFIAFQRFLAVHAPVLTDLTLEYFDHTGNPMMEFSHLPDNAVYENVTNLKLVDANLQSVSFLQSFPNLKKLELTCVQPGSQYSQELVGNWTIESCTELDISMNDFKAEDVRQLISKLPNLESLHAIAPNTDNFQVICDLLPKLAHLELKYGRVDDTGFSGLDEEDVARINEEERQERCWWPMTEARPNLTGLMNLKRFKMKHTYLELGYTTAVCVQKLPCLQEFSLEECGDLHPILEDLQIQFPWTSQ